MNTLRSIGHLDRIEINDALDEQPITQVVFTWIQAGYAPLEIQDVIAAHTRSVVEAAIFQMPK